MQHPYGSTAQAPYQQSNYGGAQYQSNPIPYDSTSISPPVEQRQQWGPPTQSPQQTQQSWNPPSTASPEFQPPPSTSGYNPSTYGPMPGSQAQTAHPPPVPPRDYSFSPRQHASSMGYGAYQNQQGSMSPVPPLPPPKLPQNLQEGGQSSQQYWPQQTSKLSQSSGSSSQNSTQSMTYHQTNRQGVYSSQPPIPPPYNAAATIPPSQVPSGSYFPPPQAPSHSNYGSMAPGYSSNIQNTSSPATTSLESSVLSPNESHPAYIPPSLSGQGVAAYMPANTNPLPGVYVPPPPDIPAWTQAQHAPLQAGTKRFKYTRPVTHSNHQSVPAPYDTYGTANIQRYQATHTAQQPQPMQSNSNQHPSSRYSYAGQSDQGLMQNMPQNRISLDQQTGIHSQHYAQGTPQPQHPFEQNSAQVVPAPWKETSGQTYGGSAYPQQPLIPSAYSNAPQNAGSQSWQKQGGQIQHTVPSERYSLDECRPVQTSVSVSSHAQQNQAVIQSTIEQPLSHCQISAFSDQSDPVSPLQQNYRQSLSLSTAIAKEGLRQNDSLTISTNPSESVHSPSEVIHEAPATPVGGKTGATVLGMGGPSDWEHFGSGVDEEIDDTQAFGVRIDQPSPQQLDSTELPTSAAQQSTELAVPTLSEDWPTPPAPAPLNLNHQASLSQPIDSRNQDDYAPTPLSNASGLHDSNLSIVSVDIGGQANAKPLDAGRHEAPAQEQWLMPSSKDQSTDIPAATVLDSFVMDDGSWTPQDEPSQILRQQTSKHAHSSVVSDSEHLAASAYGSRTLSYDEVASLERQLASAQDESARHFNEIKVLQQALEEVQRQLEAEATETNTLRIQLTALKSEHDLKVEEARSLRKQLDESKTDYQRDMDDIKEQLKEARVEHEQDVAKLRKELQEAREQEKRKREEAIDLQKQLEAEKTKVMDPPQPRDLIPDLDPWYIDSLHRYISMLRAEDKASAVQEKIEAFTIFLAAESQMRGLGYHREPVKTPGASVAVQTVVVPEIPSVKTKVAPSPRRPTLPVSIPSDSHAVVDEDIQYSPGGRPILGQRRDPTHSDEGLYTAAGDSPARPSSRDDPILVKSSDAQLPESPAMQKGYGSPTYRPYRHSVTASTSEPSTQSAILTPTSSSGDELAKALQSPESTAELQYKPYSPAESNTITPEMTSSRPRQSLSSQTLPLAARRRPEEIFFTDPGQLHPQPLSSAIKSSEAKRRSFTTKSMTTDPLNTLTRLLPATIQYPSKHQHHRLAVIRSIATSFPADYSYIQSITRTWEAGMAATRARLEAARRSRQEELEARTNQLFNDNEIAYPDIAALEDEFHIEETERKAQENRDECKAYVENVFEPVYSRLQDDIRQLMELFMELEELVRTSVGGREALFPKGRDESGDADRPATLEGLQVLRTLHLLIEERHEKVVQAVAERDRRYKRTEIQPLYAAGNIAKMKTVERHFENAERSAVVRAKEENMQRVAELMAVCEAATVRAVSDNQEFRDQVVEAVKKVETAKYDVNRANTVMGEVPGRAREVLRALARSSRDIMRCFHEVELELHNAHFDVEIAKVKMEGADPEMIESSQGQRKDEEMKLRRELDRKLRVIDEDLVEAEAILGTLDGGDRKALVVDDEESTKEARLKAALEGAKRRNGHV